MDWHGWRTKLKHVLFILWEQYEDGTGHQITKKLECDKKISRLQQPLKYKLFWCKFDPFFYWSIQQENNKNIRTDSYKRKNRLRIFWTKMSYISFFYKNIMNYHILIKERSVRCKWIGMNIYWSKGKIV